MDVAIIGLGQMGSAMAHQLLDAGHAVSVWNRNPDRAKPLAARGASVAESPLAAARAGTVLTMLADDRAVEAVAFGDSGILAAGPDILHISSSTVSVGLTERLAAAHAEAGQRFVSAQVLGRPDVAAAGKLSVIAAGAEPDLDRAAPVLDAIGAKTIRMGDRPAMAAAAKAAANFGIASIIEMVTEQIRIVAGQGVEPARMVELLTATDFGSRMVGVYGPLIADGGSGAAGFTITLGRKDVGLAIDAADGAALPLAELLAARLDAIIAAGGGGRDWSTLGQ